MRFYKTYQAKAFTLIELLIVIGVLGILAAGLLAAVDPFEQLKKARDANNRNAVIELHNAYTRYYATHGNLPWDYVAGASAACQNLVGGGQPFERPTNAPYTAVPVDDGAIAGLVDSGRAGAGAGDRGGAADDHWAVRSGGAGPGAERQQCC